MAPDKHMNQLAANSPRANRHGVRGRTLITLRWVAVIGQSLAVLFVAYGLHFTIPLAACLAVISASAWLNIFLSFSAPRLSSQRYTLAQLAFDLVQIAVLLGLTGGLANPFLLFLGVPVVVAITALPLRHALMLALLAAAALAALALFALPLPWTAGEQPQIPELYILGQVTAMVIATSFIAFYVWRVSQEGNRMQAALTATEAVLAKESRLSALGGLAAAVAHELGTPLGTIALVAGEMRHALPEDDALSEDAALLVEQARRCRTILARLSTHGVGEDPVHARHSLAELLEEIAAPLRRAGAAINTSAAPKSGCQEDRMPVLKRQPEIMHALGAFAENAADFSRQRVDLDGYWDDNWIEVIICDDGPGFDDKVLDRLGEPYVTSRPGGDKNGHGGLGLGVFIAKTLVERTGGVVKLGASAKLGGAMVRIIWPRPSIEVSSSL